MRINRDQLYGYINNQQITMFLIDVQNEIKSKQTNKQNKQTNKQTNQTKQNKQTNKQTNKTNKQNKQTNKQTNKQNKPKQNKTKQNKNKAYLWPTREQSNLEMKHVCKLAIIGLLLKPVKTRVVPHKVGLIPQSEGFLRSGLFPHILQTHT